MSYHRSAVDILIKGRPVYSTLCSLPLKPTTGIQKSKVVPFSTFLSWSSACFSASSWANLPVTVAGEASPLMRQAGFFPSTQSHGAVPFHQLTPQGSATSLVSSLSVYSSVSFPDSSLTVLICDSSDPSFWFCRYISASVSMGGRHQLTGG